jgi:hypothetical protein
MTFELGTLGSQHIAPTMNEKAWEDVRACTHTADWCDRGGKSDGLAPGSNIKYFKI